MALTYEKVISVISQTPDNRKDFEVNNLLQWFRKKSDLFKNLKTELLFDIIKNLQFVTKKKDELIIRQGDKGDCMYILLRGKVTIYILYDKKPEGGGEDDKPTQPVITGGAGGSKSESIRNQLGTFVCPLGPGATFGEVALLKEDDCIRTASIIADSEDGNDLIVVDRDLYNRSVKNVLKKEFEDKTSFISGNPLFAAWPPKYKKQLAMALIREDHPYDGVLTRQGDPVTGIYFILSGEVKVVMDPLQHQHQFPKLCGDEVENSAFPMNHAKNGQTADDEEETPAAEMIRAMSACSSSRRRRSVGSDRPGSAAALSHNGSSKFRKRRVKKQPQELCLLAVGESIGDIEVLMDLETSMQTAICTQKTELLLLEMKHYERLLVKRNPKTLEMMREGLDLRLRSRLNRHSEKAVPLLKVLCEKAEEFIEQKQQQNEARHHLQHGHSKHHKTMSESFDSFVPPRGALVDIYGPGTVFHRIREREKQKQLKLQKKKNMFGGMARFGGVGANGANSSSGPQNSRLMNGLNAYGGNGESEPDDPVLNNLERRMRAWLANEQGAGKAARVTRLHRGGTEEAHPKVPVRGVHEAETEEVMTGHSWAKTNPLHYNTFNRKSQNKRLQDEMVMES